MYNNMTKIFLVQFTRVHSSPAISKLCTDGSAWTFEQHLTERIIRTAVATARPSATSAAAYNKTRLPGKLFQFLTRLLVNKMQKAD